MRLLFKLFLIGCLFFRHDCLGENVTQIEDTRENETVLKLVQQIGSQEAFSKSLKIISDYASSLRHVPSKVYPRFGGDFQGSFGWVARVQFEDNVNWAVKVATGRAVHGLQDGIDALGLVNKYCPWVAAPKVHGSLQRLGNSSLSFAVMDWVEGEKIPMHTNDSMAINMTPVSAFEWDRNWKAQILLNEEIPYTIIRQLAEFYYNLTNCPIPVSELSRMADRYRYNPEAIMNFSRTLPSFEERTQQPVHWARTRAIRNLGLLSPEQMKPRDFNGMHRLLLLSFGVEEIAKVEHEPFVLNYWDFRPSNAKIDEVGNLVAFAPPTETLADYRVIDWDSVFPVPLKLASVNPGAFLWDSFNSDEERCWTLSQSTLNSFAKELRIQEDKNQNEHGAVRLSRHISDSRMNRFLYSLTCYGFDGDIGGLKKYYSNELAKALVPTKQLLARAALEWENFTTNWFVKQGRPVPDWPPYIEIQEGLGIYGKGKLSFLRRTIHRKVQKGLLPIYGWLANLFPSSKWLSQRHCYYVALFCERYKLPTGKFSCLD